MFYIHWNRVSHSHFGKRLELRWVFVLGSYWLHLYLTDQDFWRIPPGQY